MTEFALIAPVFLTMLFGTIEGSRLLWTKQTLDEVAYSTARCMSVTDTCDAAGAQSYAVARAQGYGIAITAEAVAPQTASDCDGFPNSSRVTITHDFDSVMGGFMPDLSTEIEADSCFPELS